MTATEIDWQGPPAAIAATILLNAMSMTLTGVRLGPVPGLLALAAADAYVGCTWAAIRRTKTIPADTKRAVFWYLARWLAKPEKDGVLQRPIVRC